MAGGATACPGLDPCTVEGGAYYALPPPGWDGSSPLPATIFFHGYKAPAAGFARDEPFRAAFAAEGVLLVLPVGINDTWAHHGSPSQARDELAFMDAVRADLLDRLPIDTHRLLVTGFSQGGSLVWELACYRGRDYTAFAPIAGAFWEPLPASCPGGPIDLRHLHGTSDRTVPMAGRPIAVRFHQGDVLQSLAILRRAGGCAEAPDRVGDEPAGLVCDIWDRCSSGRELRLCLHGGEHIMPTGWVATIHRWARDLQGWGRDAPG
jgi:polyhydroxybutyrate depolymerase